MNDVLILAKLQGLAIAMLMDTFLNCNQIPYTSKQSRGKTFAVFAVFAQSRKLSRRIFIIALTAKVFPLDCFDIYGNILVVVYNYNYVHS